MKKIMFNDKYGLTEAVLSGRKTMTRRIIPIRAIEGAERGKLIVPKQIIPENLNFEEFAREWSIQPAGTIRVYSSEGENRLVAENLSESIMKLSAYKEGDIVAVAQKYSTIVEEIDRNIKTGVDYGLWYDKRHYYASKRYYAGYTNKMYVSADDMPHQIRITGVRVERLQDITKADCLREGIQSIETPEGSKFVVGGLTIPERDRIYDSAKDSFAALIDKVSGKGTWGRNPYCFAYSFELVK